MTWETRSVHTTLILVCGLVSMAGGLGAVAMWLAGRRPSGWVYTVPPKVQARSTVDPGLALERRVTMHRSLAVFAGIGLVGGALLVVFALSW